MNMSVCYVSVANHIRAPEPCQHLAAITFSARTRAVADRPPTPAPKSAGLGPLGPSRVVLSTRWTSHTLRPAASLLLASTLGSHLTLEVDFRAPLVACPRGTHTRRSFGPLLGAPLFELSCWRRRTKFGSSSRDFVSGNPSALGPREYAADELQSSATGRRRPRCLRCAPCRSRCSRAVRLEAVGRARPQPRTFVRRRPANSRDYCGGASRSRTVRTLIQKLRKRSISIRNRRAALRRSGDLGLFVR